MVFGKFSASIFSAHVLRHRLTKCSAKLQQSLDAWHYKHLPRNKWEKKIQKLVSLRQEGKKCRQTYNVLINFLSYYVNLLPTKIIAKDRKQNNSLALKS